MYFELYEKLKLYTSCYPELLEQVTEKELDHIFILRREDKEDASKSLYTNICSGDIINTKGEI